MIDATKQIAAHRTRSRWPLAVLWLIVLSGLLIALQPNIHLMLHVAIGVAAFGMLGAHIGRDKFVSTRFGRKMDAGLLTSTRWLHRPE